MSYGNGFAPGAETLMVEIRPAAGVWIFATAPPEPSPVIGPVMAVPSGATFESIVPTWSVTVHVSSTRGENRFVLLPAAPIGMVVAPFTRNQPCQCCVPLGEPEG